MHASSEPALVVVVGGGIAGLAAAHELTTGRPEGAPAPRVVVLEQAAQVGGKIRTGSVAGVPVDEGAEALLARRPETTAVLAAAGLADAAVPAATTKARIFARGALRPFPDEHVMGVPAGVADLARTGLLSRSEVLRAALDRVLPRPRLSGYAEADDLSVGSFVAGRLGPAVVARLVEPLLGGVYAGRADGLGLAATMPQLAVVLPEERSLMRAARWAKASGSKSTGPVFVSLPGGLGTLPGALAASTGAQIRTGVTVRELLPTPAGWQLGCGPASGEGGERIDADAVVLAVPAAPAARLLREVAPPAAHALGAIEYASVAVVTLAFAREGLPAEVEHELTSGSGFLVPAEAGRLVKGVTVSSAKWGWLAEAAPGLLLLRASVGRHGDEPALQRTDEELVGAVRADLAALVGLRAEPVDSRVTRWGGALPQYAPGHLSRVTAIREALEAAPELSTLAVCGAAYDGVGVPACAGSGRQAALRVLAGLAARGKMRA